uniref:Piezo transmembrane helical unit domain-containing protein n=1 Tax=Plectus sambesii TaxID=2011161 RepID=A0A914VHZ8_9BILA
MRKELIDGSMGDSIRCVKSEEDIERMEEAAQRTWQDRNVFARFITALGSALASHTELICYFLVILNHARCSGVISLPLPLLVFFWGTLCSPRPPKLFWIILI